jgi:CheY-like chemotaxis protein
MTDVETGKASVLIVDDDADLRESLVELLQDAGFSVLGAASGAEAIDTLLRARPRLVLADLTMPGVDGRSLMQQAQSILDVVPAFVFVTGAVPSAMGDIGVPVMTKPVDIDELLRLVSKHCRN